MMKKLGKRFSMKFEDTAAEEEYIRVKMADKDKLIQATLYCWIVVEIMILIEAILEKNKLSYITAGTVAILAIFSLFYQRKVRIYSENLNMGVSLASSLGIMAQLCLLLQNSASPELILLKSWQAACLQMTIIAQLLRFRYQSVAMILALVIRMTVTNMNSAIPPQVIARFVLQDFFITFTFYYIQKQERRIFKKFYDQREKNFKFKELLDDHFPQSIMILENATSELLFSNKALCNIFEISDKQSSPAVLTLSLLRLQKSSLLEPGILSFLSHLGKDEKDIEIKDIIDNLIENNFYGRRSVKVTATYSVQESSRLFEVLLIPVVWDEQDAVTIILNDITYQENLIALRIADANKDKVIATVSHELRTPLNGIIGILSIAESKTQQPEMNEYLSLCKDNANLLLGLVNSLLDLQQLRQGKIKLNIAEVGIRKLIQDTMKLFQYQCNQKGIYLKEEISAEVPERIFTDEGRMKQILINLIGNAIKFTLKGGITIHLKQDPEDLDHLRVSVSDTGIGIQEEDKNKLFKMYGKLEDSQGVNKNGVGLGLTISEALVKMLNQKNTANGIDLASQYGVGTRISLSIAKDLNKFSMKSTNSSNIQFLNQQDESEYFESCQSPIIDCTVDSQMLRYSAGPKKQTLYALSLASKTRHNYKIKLRESLSITKEFDSDPEIKSALLSNPSARNSSRSSFKTLIPNFGCILLVDDNPFNLMIARHFVEQLNYSVETAMNGQEAIEKVKAKAEKSPGYKAVLMDCQMPIMDGFEASLAIKEMIAKEEIPRTHVIAFTANSSEADIKKCFESGMSDYLIKPLLIEDLTNALKKLES